MVALASLVTQDRRRLLAQPKASAVSYRSFELLPTMLRFTMGRLCKALNTTFPTASAAIRMLQALSVVSHAGQKKNRTFSYAVYVGLLS